LAFNISADRCISIDDPSNEDCLLKADREGIRPLGRLVPHAHEGGPMSEILVVTSKVKKFIREKSEFNTSGEFIEALSQRVEKLCSEAIEKARADKRKTVKERDIP
jgi:hypothetical protein